MSADLTAILLPVPPKGPTPDEILSLVAQHGPPAIWIRIAPLVRYGIQQVEVLEGPTGLPCVAPAMLESLSQNDRKALFLHVNHGAKQVLLHAFEDGAEVASYVGEPGEAFEREVERLIGPSVDELVAADDGTRVGFGQAASRTAAVARGRVVMVNPGTPMGMGSFAFHDRGHDLTGGLLATARFDGDDEDSDDEEEEIQDSTRVALFAFDHDIIVRAWGELPGSQLAQVISSAPQEALGPLFGLRDETAAALARVTEAPGKLGARQAEHLRAFEMLALAHAPLFAGGDAARYFNERLLAILAIGDAVPVIDSVEEAVELEAMDSVLSMMAEVLPCPKPPGGYGQLLEGLSDSEVDALAPWAKPGEAYEGVIFRLNPERLLKLVQSIDGSRLGGRLDRFCRALFKARFQKAPAKDGTLEGEATEEYLGWRRGLEQRSGKDLDRFLRGWAELRLVLESAAINNLAVGLVVYDG
jgi:hypothetical protein